MCVCVYTRTVASRTNEANILPKPTTVSSIVRDFHFVGRFGVRIVIVLPIFVILFYGS